MESLNLLLILGILGVFQLFFQPFSKCPKRMTRHLHLIGASKNSGNFTSLKERHEVAKLLNELVLEDGAGFWSPLVTIHFHIDPKLFDHIGTSIRNLRHFFPRQHPR
jgi:hypothetical protein